MAADAARLAAAAADTDAAAAAAAAAGDAAQLAAAADLFNSHTLAANAARAAEAAAEAAGDATQEYHDVVRRDLELLRNAARREGWNHDTPVPLEFFGPLWPKVDDAPRAVRAEATLSARVRVVGLRPTVEASSASDGQPRQVSASATAGIESLRGVRPTSTAVGS